MKELVEQIGSGGDPKGVDVEIGDTVDMHVRIREGDKERVQIFTGTVISLKGKGTNRSITVRRIVQDEGVERVFPIDSPDVVNIVVTGRGRVRRAKLYYLRKRVGRGRRLAERRMGSAETTPEETTEQPPAEDEPEAAPE